MSWNSAFSCAQICYESRCFLLRGCCGALSLPFQWFCFVFFVCSFAGMFLGGSRGVTDLGVIFTVLFLCYMWCGSIGWA